ncbi:MAG: flavoprotein-like protein, partial [Monoraphidium minutum]
GLHISPSHSIHSHFLQATPQTASASPHSLPHPRSLPSPFSSRRHQPGPPPKQRCAHASCDAPLRAPQPGASGAIGGGARSVVMANKKIYVIYYSTYGHMATLAKAMKEGIDSVEGVEGVLYQVAETLPEDVLSKMHAAPKGDAPLIDPKTINEADGFAFGFPTRFGMMPAQMKAFFDATGGHWQSGALVGKPATCFTSVATQGSGLETTIMTALTQLVHHGMIFVPPGYSFGAGMFALDVPKGGSPWGASTLAGPDGSRSPTEPELDFAKHQGKHLAEVAKKLAA